MIKRFGNLTFSRWPAARLSMFLVCFSMLLPLNAAQADQPDQNSTLKVVIPPPEDSSTKHFIYFPLLLDLALSKTEATHGPYVIQSLPVRHTSKRLITELKRDRSVDLIWTMNKIQFETELLRIPVSLLRGLNSHRVFLIRKEDRERFANIKNLSQLRELKAGQVQYWGDTEVLRANGLPVVTSAHYSLLFNMLAAGRYDYFPRGLYEVWEEFERHKDEGLVIEQTLMIRYPAPMYFFVHPSNRALAERVETGLKLALKDGSFDELFFSIPSFKRGYEEMIDPQRTILELKLPEEY